MKCAFEGRAPLNHRFSRSIDERVSQMVEITHSREDVHSPLQPSGSLTFAYLTPSESLALQSRLFLPERSASLLLHSAGFLFIVVEKRSKRDKNKERKMQENLYYRDGLSVFFLINCCFSLPFIL